MPTISLTFIPTRDDYAKAFRAYQRRGNPVPWLNYAIYGGAFVCAILGLVYSLYLLSQTQPHTSDDAMRSFAAALLCSFFTGLFFFSATMYPFLYARQRARKLAPDDQVIWNIDDERVHIITGSNEVKTSWSTLEKVIEADKYYLLIIDQKRTIFEFLPKRAFESPDHEIDSRVFVERHLGPIKR